VQCWAGSIGGARGKKGPSVGINGWVISRANPVRWLIQGRSNPAAVVAAAVAAERGAGRRGGVGWGGCKYRPCCGRVAALRDIVAALVDGVWGGRGWAPRGGDAAEAAGPGASRASTLQLEAACWGRGRRSRDRRPCGHLAGRQATGVAPGP
jgi:hypothetical protein